jgi:hypothetical protein
LHAARYKGKNLLSSLAGAKQVSLGINQLAALVAREGDDEKLIVERLKYWTVLGLLPLEGDQNPGTGRARKYGWDALVNARILNALGDYGIGPRGMHSEIFDECFRVATEATANIEALRAKRKTVFLVIYKGPGSEFEALQAKAEEHRKSHPDLTPEQAFAESYAESYADPAIKALRGRRKVVARETSDTAMGIDFLGPHVESAIVINLSMLIHPIILIA